MHEQRAISQTGTASKDACARWLLRLSKIVCPCQMSRVFRDGRSILWRSYCSKSRQLLSKVMCCNVICRRFACCKTGAAMQCSGSSLSARSRIFNENLEPRSPSCDCAAASVGPRLEGSRKFYTRNDPSLQEQGNCSLKCNLTVVPA
jgi:hypothetical protein